MGTLESMESAVADAGSLTPVERQSLIPYYAQMMASLKREYESAAPHTPLPSEQTLQEAFGVSRTVVRQALQQLVFEGFVYREKGRGTFISPPKITEAQFQGVGGFAAEMARSGHEARTEVLEQTVLPADVATAKALGLAVGERVVALRRLRFLDEQPLLLAQTYVVWDLCRGLEEADLGTRSLYETLREEFGLVVSTGRRVFEAVLAAEEIATQLRVEVGAPIMRVELTNGLDNGRLLEYSVAHHRGDRARFELTVGSDAVQLKV